MARRVTQDPAVRKMTTEELEEKAQELLDLRFTNHHNELLRHTYQAEIYRRGRPVRKERK